MTEKLLEGVFLSLLLWVSFGDVLKGNTGWHTGSNDLTCGCRYVERWDGSAREAGRAFVYQPAYDSHNDGAAGSLWRRRY